MRLFVRVRRVRNLFVVSCFLALGRSLAFVSQGQINCGRVVATRLGVRRASSTCRVGLLMADGAAATPITSKVFGRADNKNSKEVLPEMNDEITVDTVRCVMAKGKEEQLGIMPTSQAQLLADEAGLDLVMISKDADPPVVKIINYGKFKYKSDKKKKDNKAKAKAMELKEVKMSYKIEQHDYSVRIKNAQKFISQGHRVRVILQFRGREQSHMDLGKNLMSQITEDLKATANAEGNPRREGNRLVLILYPKQPAK